MATNICMLRALGKLQELCDSTADAKIKKWSPILKRHITAQKRQGGQWSNDKYVENNTGIIERISY